jgi:hypothetical protein
MLHITNGKSAGQGIQETGIAETVLSWDDVLHEGLTPAGLSLAQTSALPFLEHALLRHLEEYPGKEDGLSRAQRQILEVIEAGIAKPVDIFGAVMDKEEADFLGDMTCWVHLSQLCQGTRPLLTRDDGVPFVLPQRGASHEEFQAQHLVLRGNGSTVLHGQADWIMLCGGIDRWLGGVHLHEQDALWRWDRQKHTLVYRA